MRVAVVLMNGHYEVWPSYVDEIQGCQEVDEHLSS